MWRPASCSRLNLRRLSSSPAWRLSSNPFPFPEHPNPTPHQIFHLPHLASQGDVKRRYYELVRIHHPDSPVVRAMELTPEVAHTRFQSICAAYDILRGKSPQALTNDSEGKASAYAAATAARRSAHTNRPDIHAYGDERWKDRIFIGAVVLTVCLFVAQTASTRFQALDAKRRKDASIRRDTNKPTAERQPPPTSLETAQDIHR